MNLLYAKALFPILYQGLYKKMKKMTTIPAALFGIPVSRATSAFSIAMVHATYTTSIPMAPVRNIVLLLNLGEMIATSVPLMNCHAAFPRLTLVLVQASVYPIMTRILPR